MVAKKERRDEREPLSKRRKKTDGPDRKGTRGV